MRKPESPHELADWAIVGMFIILSIFLMSMLGAIIFSVAMAIIRMGG